MAFNVPRNSSLAGSAPSVVATQWPEYAQVGLGGIKVGSCSRSCRQQFSSWARGKRWCLGDF
jgi:hypothetical protein